MALTYPQKQKIIEHLSDRAEWKNLFDINFFTDERRKWRNLDAASIMTACISPDGRQAYIRHHDTGATLTISRAESGFTIEDESKREYRTGGKAGDDIQIQPIRTAAQIKKVPVNAAAVHIESFGITVHMHADGKKDIFMDSEGRQLRFARPAFEIDKKDPAGRFFHAIQFNDAAAAAWGIRPVDLVNATKLVIARDMDIEPELRAFNALDEARAAQHLLYTMTEEKDYSWQGPAQWRPMKKKELGDISPLQKAWTDATDFEGYYTGLPRQFSLRKTDDGFELLTMLDHRETIWIHSNLLKKAVSGEIKPVRVLKREVTPRSLLNMLEHGEAISDHRGRAWRFAVYETPEAAKAAFLAREIFRQNFGLTGYHCGAISFREDACLLAMDEAVHAQIKAAYDASIVLRAMIREGSRDTGRMNELLRSGADLRYLDPRAVTGGRTFANEMAEAGNSHLLKALASSGVHDLKFRPEPGL